MKLQRALIALIVVFSFSCSKETLDSETMPEAQNVPAIESQLLQMVNEHRSSLGQKDLSFSQVAYKYANSHTDYMVAKGTINHDNFSARATSIAQEDNAKKVSENVAFGYKTAKKALEGWLSNDSHRKTMEGDYSHTAISVKRDPNGTLYFTQLFYLK